jgi:hypothetical protein
MAQRIQVDTQLGNERRKAIASPVDQFVQVNPNSGAAQLARALGDFAPAIRKLGLDAVDMKHADDRAEGEALAGRLALQKKSFEQAVKDGSIPRGANPFFFAGVKEQYGKVAATKFSSDLRAATALDENMKTTTSIAEYDEFVKGKSEEWLKNNVPANQRDEFFDASFNDMALNALAGQREQFAAGLADRVEKLGDETWFRVVSEKVQTLTSENRATVAAELQAEAEAMIAQGRAPAQVIRTMARSVKETAVEKRSYAMLELLGDLKGKDGILKNTEYGKKLLLEGREEVRKAVLQLRDDAIQEKEIERADRTRTTLGEAVKALAQNPQANLKQFIADNGDIPELVGALNTMKNNMGNLTFDDDQRVYGDLATRIWVNDGNRTTASQIAARVNNGLTTATAVQLFNILDMRNRAERDGADDPIRKALSDPGYMDEKTAILSRLEGIMPKDMSDRGQRLANSTAKLSVAWLSYLDNGGAAKPWEDRRKWLNAEAAKITAQEEASIKARVDPKGPAFKADGSSTEGPKGPRFPAAEAYRMGREIQTGNLTQKTRDYMTRNRLTQSALRAEVESALEHYHTTPGGK